MKVLFLAAEAEPFVKIGELGELAGMLPRALRSLPASPERGAGDMGVGDTKTQGSGEESDLAGPSGDGIPCEGGEPPGELASPAIDVRLALPFHGMIPKQDYVTLPLATFAVQHSEGPIRAEVVETCAGGVPVYLISGFPIQPDAPVYSLDAAEDGYKFTFFSLAALQLARALQWAPDIVHANDWHTAPALYALRTWKDPFFNKTATVLGVHNLPYLGEGASLALRGYGLPPAAGSALPAWAQDLPLPLGLLSTDHIVTPSPSYAREILTPEFGSGLEGFLSSRAASISGILNGIDPEKWDPRTDPAIPACFSPGDLDARLVNREAVLQELELNPSRDFPLITMITHIDSQKGVDLLAGALLLVEDLPWQFVILGKGAPALENAARRLQYRYPGRVRAILRTDPALSHRLYAGSDLLIMPSRYEPCGLNQMIAMRYGCVPVARATGGLRDTIDDYDLSGQSTGFLFEEPRPEALAGALHRALRVYANPPAWRALQLSGMAQDFSWERSARQYGKLYKSLRGE